MRLRRPSGDDGNAILEFVGLSVVLLIPFVYFLLTVFAVQRGSFGVTQAAREAGRVLATSDSVDTGLARARLAAGIALSDQGVSSPVTLAVVPAGSSCTGAKGTSAASLEPGARFTLCVISSVALPFTDQGLFHLTSPASIAIRAGALVSVDAYRAAAKPTGGTP